MNHNFDTLLLNKNWTFKTQVINDVKNILVNDKKQTYSYEEILKVVDLAHSMDRRQYGWDVKFDDGQHKKLFIRSTQIEKCNHTTRSKQTIFEWIDQIYDRDVKQINLF